MIILDKIELQAHKGVSSECPENTMSAFRCAVMQGYDVIEVERFAETAITNAESTAETDTDVMSLNVVYF